MVSLDQQDPYGAKGMASLLSCPEPHPSAVHVGNYFHLLQTLVHYSEQPTGLPEEVQGG